MKTRKFMNIKVLSILALTILSLSSCLKDPRYVDFSASPPLIEFPFAGFNTNKTTLVSIYTTTTTAPQTSPNTVHTKNTDASGKYVLTVAVNLASAKTLDANTTVTVAVDNSVLKAAATSTATTALVTPATTSTDIPQYFPLPASSYTVSNFTPVITAGQRLAYFTVTIDPSTIGGSTALSTNVKNYALRFRITDGGGQQISSFNAITYLVQASL